MTHFSVFGGCHAMDLLKHGRHFTEIIVADENADVSDAHETSLK